ncbi:MAG: hypothetical protein AB1414_10835, partial [bacterium]
MNHNKIITKLILKGLIICSLVSGWSVNATCQDPPPSAPTGLKATAGNNQVTLNWNANTESDCDGY